MASQIQTLPSELGQNDDDDKKLEEEELEELEADVNRMAQKILEYRATLPDQLKNALTSTLAAQRPIVPTRLDVGSDPAPSSSCNPNQYAGGPIGAVKGISLAEEDKETAEKMQLLKRKISSNVTAMPVLLNRMKECISRIDNLQSCNGFVHPAFRSKRTS